MRNHWFITLWVGQTVSAFGNPFTFIATAWYVYAITGSKLALGGIMLANTIPLVCMRIFAGTFVDRWDRRHTMLVTDWIRTMCLALVVLLLFTGNAHLWYFYVLNVILGLSDAFFQPAAFALLPNLIRQDQLVQANSLFNLSVNGAMILGPAVAGFVVAGLGASAAFGVDGATFAVSALSLLFLPSNAMQSLRVKKHFLHDLAEGFLFFREHVGLLWLLMLSGVSNASFGMLVPVVLPYSLHVLHAGAQGFGMLQTAIGVGMLVGSVIAPIFKRFVRRKVMIPANIFGGIMFICFALTHQFWLAIACAVGSGIGTAIWNTFSATFYQELVPDAVRGRVQSVRLLLAQGASPIGMAIGPVLSDWLSVGGVFVLAGGFVITSGLVAYPRATVRALDKLDTAKLARTSHR